MTTNSTIPWRIFGIPQLENSIITTKLSSNSVKSPEKTPSIITLDLETTGLNWQKDTILLNGYRKNRQGTVRLVPPGRVDDELYSYLSDKDTTLSGHNIKFDALFLARAGYRIDCQLECTKILAYLNWPSLESHGLKSLVENVLKSKVTHLDDLLFKPLKRESGVFEFQDQYFVIDGKLGRKDLITLYHEQDILNVDRIRGAMTASAWFNDVEKPLTKILFETELYGCPLDKTHLELLQYNYQQTAEHLLGVLGTDFNPNSPAQVADKIASLGVDLDKISERGDNGKYRVDKQVLKQLAWKGSAFAKSLLEYRRLSKILGTYIHPLLEGSRLDGRIHGSFNQAGSENLYGEGRKGTSTGRLSSNNPNLQNIPARTKEGKEVRKAFIAPEGMSLFDTDLKQIEPRLVGHFSQSPKLIYAYNNNLDTHRMFGEDIFGPSITDIERFIGKTSWLATVYGCGYKKLLLICELFSDAPLVLELGDYLGEFDKLPAKRTQWNSFGDTRDSLIKEFCNEEEARTIYAKWMFFKGVQDRFMAKNPEIMGWRREHIARTARNGYVQTIGGRTIRITGLDSKNKRDVIKAERECVNYTIQGSSADIIKLVVVEMDKQIVRPDKGRMMANVHDEILGALRDPLDISLVKNIMCNTVRLNNIPMDADCKIVANWSEK